jgi:hypothetical protein
LIVSFAIEQSGAFFWQFKQMMMLAVPTLQKMFPFLELAFVRN